MTAVGWRRPSSTGSAKKSGSTFAKATRAFFTRISVFVDDVRSPAMRMALAALISAAAK